MDFTSLRMGNMTSNDELAVVAEFIKATNSGDLATLVALFAEDAQVNDQLRNFWGRAEIASWLEHEIVGEKVELDASDIKRHHDMVIVNAEMRGDFEMPRVSQRMVFDLYFAMREGKIVRLLILLVRADTKEPDIRRTT